MVMENVVSTPLQKQLLNARVECRETSGDNFTLQFFPQKEIQYWKSELFLTPEVFL